MESSTLFHALLKKNFILLKKKKKRRDRIEHCNGRTEPGHS